VSILVDAATMQARRTIARGPLARRVIVL